MSSVLPTQREQRRLIVAPAEQAFAAERHGHDQFRQGGAAIVAIHSCGQQAAQNTRIDAAAVELQSMDHSRDRFDVAQRRERSRIRRLFDTTLRAKRIVQNA